MESSQVPSSIMSAALTVPQATLMCLELASALRHVEPQTFSSTLQTTLLPMTLRLSRFRWDMISASSDGNDAPYKSYVAMCIPIWEALHHHTSLLSLLRRAAPEYCAVLLQLISLAFPDAGDKRCFYNGGSLTGDSTARPGHLHVPITTERLPPFLHHRGSTTSSDGSSNLKQHPFLSLVSTLNDAWASDAVSCQPAASAAATMSQWCATMEGLMSKLMVVAVVDGRETGGVVTADAVEVAGDQRVPEVVTLLQSQMNSGSVEKSFVVVWHIVDVPTSASRIEDGGFTLDVLQWALMKLLMLLLRRPDTTHAAERLLKLMDASWCSRRIVFVGQAQDAASSPPHAGLSCTPLRTLGDVFAFVEPMVRSWHSTLKSSIPGGDVTQPVQRAANRTWWAVAHHAFLETEQRRIARLHPTAKAPPSLVTNDDADADAVASDNAADDDDGEDSAAASFAQRAASSNATRLQDDIPADARFSDDGTSAHLRDADQLVRILRGVVHMAVPSEGSSMKALTRRLIWERNPHGKREREGPVLMPVSETLEDSFRGGRQRTTQERIVVNADDASGAL